MFSCAHARKMRRAISPLFATSNLRISSTTPKPTVRYPAASPMRRCGVIAAISLVLAAPAAAGTKLVVTGHGWGHGVGMSQWGAYGYSRHGWSFERILAHYYPGTTLADAPVSHVRV